MLLFQGKSDIISIKQHKTRKSKIKTNAKILGGQTNGKRV
jgi:hypothetical protein